MGINTGDRHLATKSQPCSHTGGGHLLNLNHTHTGGGHLLNLNHAHSYMGGEH